MAFDLPQTIDGWEKILCRHFLMSLDGDASPLRSFEISRSTLAESCGGDAVADADASLQAFRDVFTIKATTEALEKGRYRRLDREGLPGCFGFLALTLLVDGSLDEDIVDLGAFRTKLAQFLRLDRSFSNLSGVASMWGELKSWLDDDSRRKAGYRSLELPRTPLTWTHIGLTLGLSFPSRRDKRMMRVFLEGHPAALTDPRSLLDGFRRTAEGSKASFGMREAFDEFQHDFLAGRRALAAHRFWVFVQGVATGRDVSKAASEISLQLLADQDGEWTFVLEDIASTDGSRLYPTTLGSAVREAQQFERHHLSSSIGKGYLLFRQVGHATWRATGDISECAGKIFVGMNTELAARVGVRLGALDQGQSWRLTAHAVPVAVVEAVLSKALGGIDAPSSIVRVSVHDGVWSGDCWLGRPQFLPMISADGGEIDISFEDGSRSFISCQEDTEVAGLHRLRADRAVEGRYLVAPKVAAGQRRPWAKHISFVADAHVHERADRAARGLPILEWKNEKQSDRRPRRVKLAWLATTAVTDDLVEAVYAGGGNGWDEADIVSLLRRWSSLNPWDLLRWLQDSKVIAPALRPQWRGRVWRLVPPTLIVWRDEAETILVDGCVPARLLRDFLRAVDGERGTAFREIAQSPSALPIIGCIGVRVDLLASRLGWGVTGPSDIGDQKLDFDLTPRRPDGYLLSNKWLWELGRFGEPSRGGGPVELGRWTHQGGRDHDIYIISQGTGRWHFLSRNAAIAAAHCLAGVPLFGFNDARLKRLRREGALPDAVAAALRYATLSNPELNAADGTYAYPADVAQAAWVASVLPNLVSGLPDLAGADSAEAVSLSIHSGGRIRVAWKSGRLSTTHSC